MFSTLDLDVRGVTVSHPSVFPETAVFDKQAGAAWNTDIEIEKNDGDFTFDGILNGTLTLVPGTDYTVSGNTVTISADYLSAVDSDSVSLTFHYTGTVGEDGYGPNDPSVVITLRKSCAPVIVVKGSGGEDITDRCSVLWKWNGSSYVQPIIVDPGTTLEYSVSPGDGLETGGLQYYLPASGSVTVSEPEQTVEVVLEFLGNAYVTVTDGPVTVPDTENAGYEINWYSDPEGTRFIGSGRNSPLCDIGQTLYYSVRMTGENSDMYENIRFGTAYIAEFGRNEFRADAGHRTAIFINVSGTGRSGAQITNDDCNIRMYLKKDDGSYYRISSSDRYTDAVPGTTYYYEITPAEGH